MRSHLVETVERDAWEDLYARMPPPLAAGLGRYVAREGEILVQCAPRIPAGEFNRAYPVGLAEGDEARLDAVIAHFERAGAAPVIQVVPGATAVEEALRARGFAPFVEWVKLAHEEEATGFAEDVRVVDASEAATVATAIADGFAMPPPIRGWLAALVGAPGWHAFLASQGGMPVGGAFLRVQEDTGWLGIGAVVPGARGKGAQRALIRARLAYGRALGVRTFVSETGDLPGQRNVSLENLLACGFTPVHRRAGWRRG